MQTSQISSPKFRRTSRLYARPSGLVLIAQESDMAERNLNLLSGGATGAASEQRIIVCHASSKANPLGATKRLFVRSMDSNRFSFTSHKSEALSFRATECDLIATILRVLNEHPREVMKAFTITRAESKGISEVAL